jgi:hypothetical protein
VEARLETEWVAYFFDKAVSFHCRKGSRGTCDCTYCQRKNSLTALAGNGIKLWRMFSERYPPQADKDVNWWLPSERHYYMKYSIDAMRDIVRDEYKEELRQLKKDVLYQ